MNTIIEEKAKAYDESIGRAKEMIKAMTNIGGVAKVDDIVYLFPELRESDDERIRRKQMKRDTKEIVSIIGVTVIFLAIIAVSVMAIVKAKQAIVEAQQPVVYQVDTTKARILFEDTWGKIIFVKEEDL